MANPHSHYGGSRHGTEKIMISTYRAHRDLLENTFSGCYLQCMVVAWDVVGGGMV
jgi:hypothetical protein